METHLADWLRDTPQGHEAEAILRACVHCGFCTATCPTYQLLGDELDGPRGRIYQIKQVVEGEAATRSVQLHLDRCLTCRNCETTCPSGVQYGRLLDIGREIVARQVKRPRVEAMQRAVLREGLTSPRVFGAALGAARVLRPLLPAALRAKVGESPREAGSIPSAGRHERKVLMLNGCVQPAMAPNIDAATRRVLDRIGVEAIIDPNSGCCGAIRQHLDDPEGARADARRNVATWASLLESGAAEAIVINASGCGVMVKDYGHLLHEDPQWGRAAKRVSEATLDLAQWLPQRLEPVLPLLQDVLQARGSVPRLAFHPPCTLQHGQQVRGAVESLLAKLGVAPLAFAEAHLCCGSAGTYSLLQSELSRQLRDRKLEHIAAVEPQQILSANVGCISHLQSGTRTPVRHWIEWIDELLAEAA